MLVVLVLLALAVLWILRTGTEPQRVNLIVTATIGALTAIYALVTYEILIQNQLMAEAALESSRLMERSLRFSATPSILFKTVNTKHPTFGEHRDIAPVPNEDYRRALAEYREGAQQQGEYVFAVVSNKGQGAATNLVVEASYRTLDSSNPNREATISKRESVQILEPNTAVAICIFISKVPTADDKVTLVSASVSAGDFYRDAVGEPPQVIHVHPDNHHTEHDANSVVRIA